MARNTTTQNDTQVKLCSRCKGTGFARYNHRNGDVHCYLCNGEGLVIKLSAAEKTRREADTQWATDAHMKLVGGYHSFRNQIRRPIREATETQQWIRQAERDEMSAADLSAYEAARADDDRREAALERRITFWADELLTETLSSAAQDRRDAEKALLAEARRNPETQAKIEANEAARQARIAEAREKGMIVYG